jgi:hypothetical protein
MIDLLSPTQAAVVAALQAGVNSDLAAVYDTVDQDTQPPFVIVGEIRSTNDSAREEQLEEFEVDVHSVYRGGDRTVLMAIMHQVRTALDGVALAAAGVSFWKPEYLEAGISSAGPDGVTYAGVSTFKIVAEPA